MRKGKCSDLWLYVPLVPHCVNEGKAVKEDIVKHKQIGKENIGSRNEWRGALLQNRNRLELKLL